MILKAVFWSLSVIAVLGLTILQFCDNANDIQHPLLKELVLFLYSHRLKVSLIFAILQLICASGIAWVAWCTPFDHEKLQRVLNQIVSHCFDEIDYENHDYRATIFQIRGLRGIRKYTGQWVGIVCRSGENYDQSETVFLVDRMSPDKSTGIVGRCFAAEGQTIMPTMLLPEDPESYKQACHLADAEYNAMNVKSRIVFATGIKRHGKLWGFLVLDTTDSRQLPGVNQQKSKRRDIGSWAEVVATMIA